MARQVSEKSNIFVRVFDWLYLKFTTEGGGAGTMVLWGIAILIFFAFVIYKVSNNQTLFVIVFLCILIFLGVFSIYFMSLSKDKVGQKIFLSPLQRYLAYRLERKLEVLGTDTTGFKEIAEKTKTGQPQFASNERGVEIAGVITEKPKP